MNLHSNMDRFERPVCDTEEGAVEIIYIPIWIDLKATVQLF